MRAYRLLLVLGLGAAAPAAQPWSFEPVEGLPHSTVDALLQDRRGFLWIGTADGLARYDGRQFRVFRRRPGRPGTLPSSTVQALAEGPDGSLWVGTSAGACRLAEEATGRFECPPPRLDVLDLVVGAGAVWIVSVEGAWRFDGEARAFRLVSAEDGALRGRDGSYTAGFGARAGQMVAVEGEFSGGAFGRFRYDTARGRFVRDGGGRVPAGSIGLVAEDGEVVVVPASPFRARGAAGAEGGVTGNIHMAPAGAGARWVGVESGLFRWDGRALTPAPLTGGALGNAVLAVAVDRAGAVWVGTRNGLFVHDPSRARFAHLDPAEVGAAAPVMAVATGVEGDLWVGTLGGGLVRQRPGRAPERAEGPAEEALVWALHATGGGDLLVGTDAGLCRRRAGARPVCVRQPLARSDGRSFVYALEGDGDEGVWAGGSALVHLDARTGRVRRRLSLEDVAGFSTLSVLHRDRRGRLWVGAEKRGLWRLDAPSGPLRRMPIPGLDAVSVWSIHEAEGGVLWLGTSDGLFRFDPGAGRAEPHAADLPASTVYGVLPDGPRLWLSTARGLAWYRPENGTLRPFGADEGVRNIEFNRRAIHRGADGRFHLGGMQGLTSFDPRAFRGEAPPPSAVVTSLRVEGADGQAVYAGRDLRLGPDARALAFDVAAPLPAGGSALRYAYRLDPLDRDWVEIDGEPVVRLAGLPPGRYTFRARASRGGGVWGEPAVMAITLEPPWYRTLWFRLLAAGALAAAVGAAVRVRIRAVRREERMRWRIASDLHDDIGSRLASVALMAEHVRDQGGLAEPQAGQLTSVALAARSMVESLREIVWFVDPAHERPGAFAARVREAAASLVGTGVTVDAPAHSRLDGAPLAFRRDVFLVLKEALHNAARHAEGAAVTVRLVESGGDLVLSVHDDGPGFAPAAISAGTGLRSLRHRADALGGTLDVESVPGRGTTVTLRAPLP